MLLEKPRRRASTRSGAAPNRRSSRCVRSRERDGLGGALLLRVARHVLGGRGRQQIERDVPLGVVDAPARAFDGVDLAPLRRVRDEHLRVLADALHLCTNQSVSRVRGALRKLIFALFLTEPTRRCPARSVNATFDPTPTPDARAAARGGGGIEMISCDRGRPKRLRAVASLSRPKCEAARRPAATMTSSVIVSRRFWQGMRQTCAPCA